MAVVDNAIAVAAHSVPAQQRGARSGQGTCDEYQNLMTVHYTLNIQSRQAQNEIPKMCCALHPTQCNTT